MKPVYQCSNLGYIYSLSSPGSESVRYIGQTIEATKRLSSHIHLSKNKSTHKEKWISSLINQGQKPVMEILWVGNPNELNAKEDQYISLFKSFGANLTNATSGGKGSRGRVYTPEMKAKQSAIQKGRPRGWEFSEETLRKMSERSRGRKLTEAQKMHLSAVRKGQPSYWTTHEMPEQMKRDIAERGKYSSKKVIASKDGIETTYNSCSEAGRSTMCSLKGIRMVALGIHKQTNGYQFKYA